ncbi:MAG: PorT family protein, partial [Proteobacteria bacterium]
MKMTKMMSLLLAMTLGTATVAQARGLQQEIDAEAKIAMKTSGARPYTLGSLVHIVPIAGLTFSNFKGASGNYSFSNTSGYDAGIGILIGRGDLQFETGLMYAERGSKESFRFNFQSWDLSYQNKYLELPLLARYNIMNNKDVRLYVKGGVNVGVLQSSHGQMANMQNYYAPNTNGAYMNNGYYGATSYNANLANDNNTKSAFASTDLRWVLGLGGQVRMTRTLAWTLEGDYQNSTS